MTAHAALVWLARPSTATRHAFHADDRARRHGALCGLRSGHWLDEHLGRAMRRCRVCEAAAARFGALADVKDGRNLPCGRDQGNPAQSSKPEKLEFGSETGVSSNKFRLIEST